MCSVLIFVLLIAGTCAQTAEKPKYVFDYYLNSPALDSEGVISLMQDAVPGITFPLNHDIPKTSFDCAKLRGPGYYADPEEPSLCQVFYRCDISGNQTGFLCPNSTLFNQITLACDYYFNVDCGNSTAFYYYGNSRLYQGEKPLFDTPPKDYYSSLSGSYEGEPEKSPIAVAEARQHAEVSEATLETTSTGPQTIALPVKVIVLRAPETTEMPTTVTSTEEPATQPVTPAVTSTKSATPTEESTDEESTILDQTTRGPTSGKPTTEPLTETADAKVESARALSVSGSASSSFRSQSASQSTDFVLTSSNVSVNTNK